MPIYEFYCDECNTIFSFLSRRINTTAQPDCPGCSRPGLKRQPSMFATIGKAKESGDEPELPIDEHRMEKALASLASEAEGMSEEDPRQMVRLMRKLSESTGLSLGPAMEEAMARMEAGEDPEQIEQEMGDLLETEEPFLQEAKKGGRRAREAPRRDETLYEL